MDLPNLVTELSWQFILSEALLAIGAVGAFIGVQRIKESDVAQTLYQSYAAPIFDAIDRYYAYTESIAEKPDSYEEVAAAAFEVIRKRNPEIESKLRPAITRYVLRRLNLDFLPVRSEDNKIAAIASDSMGLGAEVYDVIQSMRGDY